MTVEQNQYYHDKLMFILKINGISVDDYLHQMKTQKEAFCAQYCRLKGKEAEAGYSCPYTSLYYNLEDHTFKMISTVNIIFDENNKKTLTGPFICAGFVLDKENDEDPGK
jgi:hypothetical protein